MYDLVCRVLGFSGLNAHTLLRQFLDVFCGAFLLISLVLLRERMLHQWVQSEIEEWILAWHLVGTLCKLQAVLRCYRLAEPSLVQYLQSRHCFHAFIKLGLTHCHNPIC